MRVRGCGIGLLLLSGICRSALASGIWIDTDPAIGAPYREVDDAYALVLAFHSPESRIAGISTTFGNAGLKRTTKVARELVTRFGIGTGLTANDVYSGASDARDLGQRTPATDALVAKLRSERLTYVALGPLTNLATVLQLHPQLSDKIEHVIFVGGRSPGRALAFGPRGGLQIHDANVVKDPIAVRVVMESTVPVTLAPPETSSQLVLDREQWRELARGGEPAQFLRKKTRLWHWFWTTVVQHRGAPLFDALAVVAVSQPELVWTEPRHAWVRPTGELVAERQPSADSRPVRFITRLRRDCEAAVVRRLQAADER